MTASREVLTTVSEASQSHEISPQALTMEDIQTALGMELDMGPVSDTRYGSGSSGFMGEVAQGNSTLRIALFDVVMNDLRYEWDRKSAPTVSAKRGVWNYSGQAKGYIMEESSDSVIHRVEKVEVLDGGIRFTGTTGIDESVLEIFSDGRVNYQLSPSTRADQIPSLRDEVIRLKGPDASPEVHAARINALIAQLPLAEERE